MRIEKFFPGDPGAPVSPAGPAGPAGPVTPVSPLSPLSPLGPSKHPVSVKAAAHATIAIATRIICSPPQFKLELSQASTAMCRSACDIRWLLASDLTPSNIRRVAHKLLLQRFHPMSALPPKTNIHQPD